MALFLFALVIMVFFIERWSIINALKGIEFDYYPSTLLAAPDEIFEITTHLGNSSMRFVPFLKVAEKLPSCLILHLQEEHSGTKYNYLKPDFMGDSTFSYLTYLMPRSRLRRNIPASIHKRGRYVFPGADLSGGDFLGLGEERQSFRAFSEIVVYPKESDSVYVKELMGGFLGDLSVRRFIIEDPVLTAGFRDYSGREPMKAISWTQSARMGNIMVKSFDYTTEPSVTVLLNTECNLDKKEELIENCFSITHAVCKILEERRIKYDFYTNATTQGALVSWSYIGEGLGNRHFFTILEGLGRASFQSRESFSATIKRMKPGSTRSLIIITPTGKEHVYKYLDKANINQTLIIPAAEQEP